MIIPLFYIGGMFLWANNIDTIIQMLIFEDTLAILVVIQQLTTDL